MFGGSEGKMLNRVFIHCSADVRMLLRYAIDNSFQVIVDEAQSRPSPGIVHARDIGGLDRGSFYFVRPAWQFGTFQIEQMSSGIDKGKYDVAPRVNFACLSVLFQGERRIDRTRVLGHCDVTCHDSWLRMPEQEVVEAPPETKDWFKRLVRQLDSGVVIKAGVHRYHVTRSVIADPSALECRPPFDFIPWSREILFAKKRGEV